jgi:high-affinity nickel-transport protein
MIDLAAIIGLGFLLGMRHATDPDHVVAVTTIVSREREVKQAALIGVAWGAGHTLTILLVGSAMILFRVVLSPRVGLAMELAVAVMLVFLGIRNMGGRFGCAALPEHEPRNFAGADHHQRGHVHPHPDCGTPVRMLDRWFGRVSVYQFLRPMIVGVVHGLAGSAAIALLVVSTIHNIRWAAAYLVIFGIGTILGMMLITTSIASACSFGQSRFVHMGRHFASAAGIVSLAFGLFLIYQIGFVRGLFMAHATWVAH